MTTKVKGLIKGIKKNISARFEDEKEEEIQIGEPTDVKHVSHIGCETAVESPSWMKGFDASSDTQSIDSSHRSTRSVESSRDLPSVPRAARNRHRSMDNTLDSSDSSLKARRTRRNRSSEARRRTEGEDSNADVPKKSSRRRKPKDESATRSSSNLTDDSDHGSDV
ncbi:CRIB domain-containing protein RIC6-like [Cynara cardunculus var. scolymus]|uniref:CRIB domain-containing protein RIC6-like n=1 Tax=Cynara cardunculus var. scolymus TaxID=59895 RepID=UPI000D62DB08|nr:CRIB domain-containing protein RIC6-like [Cynara cardunculus var. scolymus]